MLRVERIDAHGIALWTIDRPQTKNALDRSTMDALLRAIASAREDATLRAVVLTGAGGVFVSGGDLRELRTATSAEDAERLADDGKRICDGLASLSVPVIAALGGPAIGGGAELAIACDMRIAEPHARLCFKHARMGVTPAWGSLPRLLSLVGAGTAARLLYTAHEVQASEALSLGLVDAVVEPGGAVQAAMAWALDVAQGSPLAVAEMKGLLRLAMRPVSEALTHQERERFIATWTSADHAEAVEAFFSNRAPRWKTTDDSSALPTRPLLQRHPRR